MASTITASTLKVTLREDIKLNGVDQGGVTTLSIGSINEISKRIVTITTNEASIATFSPTLIGQGLYLLGNVRYMRFTNLDDTNYITLTFRNEDNELDDKTKELENRIKIIEIILANNKKGENNE